MRQLCVIYDDRCGVCTGAKDWCEKQKQSVPVAFLAAHERGTWERFPELAQAAGEELIAIDDEGGVYLGAQAWLVCLWALEEYRAWSERLASPMLLPLARAAFVSFSKNRTTISRLLYQGDDHAVANVLRAWEPAGCAGGADVREYLE